MAERKIQMFNRVCENALLHHKERVQHNEKKSKHREEKEAAAYKKQEVHQFASAVAVHQFAAAGCKKSNQGEKCRLRTYLPSLTFPPHFLINISCFSFQK